MFRSKALPLLACLLGLTLAAGCGDACLALADQICACQPDDNSKAVCSAHARAAESSFAVGKADQTFCQQKLNSHACDCGNQNTTSATVLCCNKLNTPEGRAACGLVITSP